MDMVQIACAVFIYFATPTSILLLSKAYKNKTERKTPRQSPVKRNPTEIEETLKRQSLHDIPIFENTGTILAINVKKKPKKPTLLKTPSSRN